MVMLFLLLVLALALAMNHVERRSLEVCWVEDCETCAVMTSGGYTRYCARSSCKRYDSPGNGFW